MAKELFDITDRINAFGRQLIQMDVLAYTRGELRELEDDLLGALFLVRQARRELTDPTVVEEKGQRA
jgi:hypothetical protein